jgi:glycosyltransferase involved in cell wall biosynthesis
MLSGKVDIFHSSDWTQPKSYAYKVTTIHDLVPLKYPEFSSKKIVDVHKRRLEHVFKEVDKIIVPSFTTKTDVVNLGGCEERVIVIPEAVDPMLKKQSFKKSKEVLNKFNLEKRYLLSIGITPRKNTKRIIESLKIIRKEMDFELVLIGQDFVGLKREDNVRILGHVEKDEIAALYQNAQALIYPSLYEGFGLPILEAYFMGVPVVTSNFGSMKEIGEGISILVDPYDVESISAGIVEAVENRARMIQKGKNVLKKYSWEETARQTLEVYKRKI